MDDQFEKEFVNVLMAVYCPRCGIEALTTYPFPAKVGKVCKITCGHCGGVGEREFSPEWQYTDINAWPLEQALNKRYSRAPKREETDTDGHGTLQWD